MLTEDMISLLQQASSDAVVFKALAVQPSVGSTLQVQQHRHLPVPTVDSLLQSCEFATVASKDDFMRKVCILKEILITNPVIWCRE
jgi:hypothetical protein